MKYLLKFLALCFFAISLSSCQNEDNVSNTNSETELSVGYSVGSTVMFENANYYVVSNTIDSAVNNNSSRAVTEDISSLFSLCNQQKNCQGSNFSK